MKVQIIGGSGFIGSKTSAHLVRQQTSFRIVDISPSPDFNDKFVYTDVRSASGLRENMFGDAVINLAAVHRDDVTDPEEYYSTNVEGARILCEVCEEKDINKIVFTSSVMVYGFAPPGTGENGIIDPFNEYGRTKALAEDIYREWREKTLKTVA